MTYIFYCANCTKFHFSDHDTIFEVCPHCDYDHSINTKQKKEDYDAMSIEAKNQFKQDIKQKIDIPYILNVIDEARIKAFKEKGILYHLDGCRGRSITVYEDYCIINTSITVGSILTGNCTDAQKTIFYHDIVGIQYKKDGALIGYLQLETPSLQMNHQDSNFFSENTFTFQTDETKVLEIKDFITKQVAKFKQIPNQDVANLQSIASLFEKDLLTKEEYETLKAKIIKSHD